MGKIVRRGINFSGGGGSISNPTASSVTFDNTNTGLNATNVQDAVTEVNGNFTWRYVGAEYKGVPISYPSVFNELYVLVDYGKFGVYDEVTVTKNFLDIPRTIQRGNSEKTGFELVFGTNNVKLQWAFIETQVLENAQITLFYR